MAIVLGLVPHDREDLQPVAHPGELVVVHDGDEAGEQRQRDGKPRQALPARQRPEAAPGEDPEADEADEAGGNGKRKGGGGPRAILHQHRQQFEDLAAKEQVRRIERVGEEDLLLLRDDAHQHDERRDEEHGLVLPADQRVDGKVQQEEDARRGPAGLLEIGQVGIGLLERAAGDELDDGDGRKREKGGDGKRAQNGERLGMACEEARFGG